VVNSLTLVLNRMAMPPVFGECTEISAKRRTTQALHWTTGAAVELAGAAVLSESRFNRHNSWNPNLEGSPFPADGAGRGAATTLGGSKMGATIYAFIEYDDAPEYYSGAAVPAPFAYASDRIIDLTSNVGLSHAKDYALFAALDGPRKPESFEPLIGLRGLPPNVNWRIAKEFGTDNTSVGWLTPDEVEAAMKHAQVMASDLSFGARLTLEILRLLGNRLGSDRVRFVFEFGD